MATDIEALRAHIRDAYLNPPAQVVAEMIEEEGNDHLVELQKRMADLFADTGALTVSEIESGTDPKMIIYALVNLSLGSLLNLIGSIVSDEHKDEARLLAVRHFMSGLSPDTEFIEQSIDMPDKAN